MSSIVLPGSRGQCIQITDNSQPCRCLWFFPPDSLLLDQNICGLCGHGIHAHVDYVSMVVNHYPADQCAAYAQKTHLTQRCTCEAQFCEHIATDNWYRLPEPWTVLDYFNPDTNDSSLGATSSRYSDDASSPFSLKTTLSSNYSTPMFPGHATDIPFTLPPLMPIYPTLTVTRLSSHPSRNPSFKRPLLRSRVIPTRKWRNHTACSTKTITSELCNRGYGCQRPGLACEILPELSLHAAYGAEAWAGQLE